MSSEKIEIPCLGRPFQPGMLYDCRSDQLIPGLTLWDPNLLKNNLHSQPQPSIDSEIIEEDTLSEKASKLSVDASLKLSFLGGLVKVSGSANYLNDRKTSNKQARLALKYTSTSRYDQLTMTHLGAGNVQYPRIFDDQEATHVVTAVLYGADAVFIFDHDVESNEQVDKINGSLDLAVKFVKDSVGEAKVAFTEEEKTTYEKIRCHLYGDFQVDQSPSNLADALNVYRSLPSLIKKSGYVPKKVWLYPLIKLDSRAAKIVSEISLGLVVQTEMALDSLYAIEIEVNDMIKSCHPILDGLKYQIDSFKSLLNEFKTGFQKMLLTILPKIRGGEAEETELEKVIETLYQSPFKPSQLQFWINGKQREVDMISNYIYQLNTALGSKVQFATTKSEVDRIFCDLKYDSAVGLAFQISRKCDTFIGNLGNYLRKNGSSTSESEGCELLFENHSVRNHLRKDVKSFIKFVETNGESEKTRFFVYAEDRKGNHYTRIVLHNFAEDTVPVEFVPPSAPGKPTAEIVSVNPNTISVCVNWLAPGTGLESVTAFKVLYCNIKEMSENKWKEYVNSSAQLSTIIQGFVVGEKYLFKVCSVCVAGFSEYSEISLPIHVLQIENKSAADPKDADPAPESPKLTDTWVEVSHNSPFPTGAESFDGNLDGGDLCTRCCIYVAVCYIGGEACFGRARNNNGKVEAWFPYGGKELHSLSCGKFKILAKPDGFCYQWVPPSQAVDLVYFGNICPAIVSNISVSGFKGNLLGKASLNGNTAWTSYNHKELVHSGDQFHNQTFVLVRKVKT